MLKSPWVLTVLSQLRRSEVKLARPLHQMVKMSKQVQARRLEGIDKNPWVEFSQLANENEAVNLGQGFPDFAPPEFSTEAFKQAVTRDIMLNQYTRGYGHPPLVKVLAQFFGKLLKQDIDPLKDVLVTVGAYGALFYAFQALVDEGDEVILIEPYFDCYEPMTKMAGGRPVFVSLKPPPSEDGKMMSSDDWKLDPDELASKFTPRTKAIVINSPNNPLGKVFSKEELELIANLCKKHDVLCFSDEVYQWLVYDEKKHISIASLPGMWERTLTIGSAGKTFSVTGWKVGWVLGPNYLMKHLRTVHQNSLYHCPTQTQEAVSSSFSRELRLFGDPDSYFVQLPKDVQKRRDHMMNSLQTIGMRPIVPQGTYFLMADISSFKKKMPNLPGSKGEAYDSRFIKWMVKNKGLVAIPVSVFCSSEQKEHFENYIRFCFMKNDSTLKAMDEKLQQWKKELEA